MQKKTKQNKKNRLRIAPLNTRKLWSSFPVPPLSCQFSQWFLPSKCHFSVNWISFLCRLHRGEKYTIVKDKQDKMTLIFFSVNFWYGYRAEKIFKKLLFSSSLLITYHASQITFRDRSSPTEIKRGNHGGGGDRKNITEPYPTPHPLTRTKEHIPVHISHEYMSLFYIIVLSLELMCPPCLGVATQS